MADMIPWRSRELRRLREEMDTLFDRFFDVSPFRRPFWREREWAPSVNVSETPTEVIVKAELPGIDDKDIDISLQGDLLNIKGERRQEKEEKEESFHRIECSYGAFSRTVRLTSEVDEKNVKATYNNGILRIALPKITKQPSRKIEIKTE